jgi:excisionase family DNA binding protein
MNAEDSDRLLTVSDLAKWLNVSEWFIYQSVNKNTIPHLRLGSAVRFRREAIEAWIKEQEGL